MELSAPVDAIGVPYGAATGREKPLLAVAESVWVDRHTEKGVYLTPFSIPRRNRRCGSRLEDRGFPALWTRERVVGERLGGSAGTIAPLPLESGPELYDFACRLGAGGGRRLPTTMIRMTKQTDYGFVLLSELAAGDGRVANAPDLAHETRLPLPTVAKILKLLARGGVVRSQRGVKGGYALARPAREISAAQIVSALEGPVALTVCIDGTPGECDRETFCGVRGHWQRINQAVEKALSEITLEDLARPGRPLELVTIGAARALAAAERPAP